MIDSTRLAYFAAVAETSSIRRAAVLLHITPAALSRAMKTLEVEVGHELLAPHGRGIVLTDAGRELAERSRPLLADLSALTHDLGAGPQRERVLRYGSHETFGTYFASVLAAACPRTTPIEHRYLGPGAIERSLLDGIIDAGVSYIAHPMRGTTITPAGTIAMGIFGRPALRDVAFDRLVFAAPAGPVVDSPVRPQGLDGWPDHRIPRTVRFRVTHTETALEHCRMGRAVAYFPRFLVDLHNRRAGTRHKLVELPGPPETVDHYQDVYVTTRHGEEEAFAAMALREALATISEPVPQP